MPRDELDRAIEAIVLVAEEPVEARLLAQLLEAPLADVEARCRDLAESYLAEGRGFVLARVAGGWRFQTHPDQRAHVERYVLDGQSARLSAAAIETLAIVAYKQPISRAQVTAVRGVNADGVMRSLQQRGLIAEVGRDPGPGQAVLYGTTPLFLERLGLDSLAELPPLGAFAPGADVVEALETGLRGGAEPRQLRRELGGPAPSTWGGATVGAATWPGAARREDAWEGGAAGPGAGEGAGEDEEDGDGPRG
jgi:segregation and condensation protein B